MSTKTPLEVRFHLHQKPRSMAEALEAAAQPSSGRLPRIVQVLALAIHLEDMIRRGEAKDYADLARLSCLCRERISQIVRLNYLAPDIQIELLYLPPTPSGRYPISETAVRKIANLLSWADQRREWTALKQQHHLGA
ncbi:MAG: hypothetical protein ABSB35_37145 [Bryobacteraceae bacterium]|jgi:hypothetical protein